MTSFKFAPLNATSATDAECPYFPDEIENKLISAVEPTMDSEQFVLDPSSFKMVIFK